MKGKIMSELRQYLVTLATPGGEGQLEVPSMTGPKWAGERAYWTAIIGLRWGDLDEVKVVSVVDITTEHVPGPGPVDGGAAGAARLADDRH